MSDKNIKMTFGLQANHIAAIEAEIQRWNDMPPLESSPDDEKIDPRYLKYMWEKLGKELGWEPFTLALYYFEYLETQRNYADELEHTY